jgi:hypothetical protein
VGRGTAFDDAVDAFAILQGVNVTDGTTVFATVVAENPDGARVNASSNGVVIDATPPTLAHVGFGIVAGEALRFYSDAACQDLAAVCADLRADGLPFHDAWLRPLWDWRFSEVGRLDLLAPRAATAAPPRTELPAAVPEPLAPPPPLIPVPLTGPASSRPPPAARPCPPPPRCSSGASAISPPPQPTAPPSTPKASPSRPPRRPAHRRRSRT